MVNAMIIFEKIRAGQKLRNHACHVISFVLSDMLMEKLRNKFWQYSHCGGGRRFQRMKNFNGKKFEKQCQKHSSRRKESLKLTFHFRQL